jgi:multicomponent Na+:H+ antiporter subunit C
MSVVLAFTAAMMFGVGTYLVLQRKLSRVIIGLGLLTHGANILMVTAGRRGEAPLIDPSDPTPVRDLADPLPQALALTAIVISFGVTALLLALAYRSWLLSDDDEIKNVASSNEGPTAADRPATEAAERPRSSTGQAPGPGEGGVP